MGDRSITAVLNLINEISALLASRESFNRNDRYGLAPQMQRAAGIIVSSLRSGWMQQSHEEQSVLFERAFSTLRELHYQIGLAFRLGYVDEEYHRVCNSKADEARKLLAGLIASLRLESYRESEREKRTPKDILPGIHIAPAV